MINEKKTTVQEATFSAALDVNIRVIYSLIFREIITRYGRENIGFFWLMLEPMLFTSGIAISWSFFGSLHGHHIGILEFAITGYSSVLLWRNCANRAVNGVQPNYDLLFHRRVKVLDILLARSLLEIFGATLSFTFISIPLVLLGFMPAPYDYGTLFVAWFFLSWIAISIALIVGAISELSDLVERVWHIATYLFFPLSGALFMVDWLTPAMQKIVLCIPMVHGLEMLRAGYFGNHVQSWYSINFMLSFCLIATFLGLILVRFLSTRVVRK